MDLIISEDTKLIKNAYLSTNYKVEYSTLCSEKRCIIFFSGNGLYYPDTEEEFTSTVLEKDRYEWSNVGHTEQILSYYSMIIYVRDVYKSWYEKGISAEINSIDKLCDLLKSITQGYKVTTCGNSAGGYIAHIVGSALNAERIYDFAGQWKVETRFSDKYNTYDNVSKYYDSTKFANEKVMYFYSALCIYDIEQYSLIKDTNVTIFPIKSKYHGALLLNECYKYILTATSDELEVFKRRFMGKIISPRKWARELLSGSEKYRTIWNDIVDSHKSLQIILKIWNAN